MKPSLVRRMAVPAVCLLAVAVVILALLGVVILRLRNR